MPYLAITCSPLALRALAKLMNGYFLKTPELAAIQELLHSGLSTGAIRPLTLPSEES